MHFYTPPIRIYQAIIFLGRGTLRLANRAFAGICQLTVIILLGLSLISKKKQAKQSRLVMK
jgi:hypothetical protein